MKIQSLAVIFIIIILPISMILTVYTQNQMKTLELQITYDSRLKNATYDAIKAFQLNTVNSSTSELANSKMRDIEASVNTFFNSMAKNFNMEGYNSDMLKDYVPALVYTMYDGYYIYSPFTNTLTDEEKFKENLIDNEYTNGAKISDLKPYIYYSCRYVSNSLGINVVINYSLDNYITIQGIVNNKGIYESGYVINPKNIMVSGDSVSYRGVPIDSENLLKEYIGPNNDENNLYEYVKINGVKYYKYKPGVDNKTGWFSLLNGKRYGQPFDTEQKIDKNTSAKKYYIEAKEFMEKLKNWGITELTTSNARDEDGNPISNFQQGIPIFDNISNNGKSEEENNSNFTQHRLEVIRYSIEKNLSTAIANYNNYSSVTSDFQMPNLKDEEWEKILSNVSMISFLQGLSIGGKIYNGYSIITNNKNEEVVSEEAIYIVDNAGSYHRVNDKELLDGTSIASKGIFNVDFEVKSKITDEGTQYFYPQTEYASYSSIVNQTGLNEMKNVYKYLDNCDNPSLKEIYYTALARERYGMYRTANNADEMKANY